MLGSATDVLVHTWEAPACASSACVGRFDQDGPWQCVFAQQGGLAVFQETDGSIDAVDDLHVYDRLDKVMTIELRSALPAFAAARCRRTAYNHYHSSHDGARPGRTPGWRMRSTRGGGVQAISQICS